MGSRRTEFDAKNEKLPETTPDSLRPVPVSVILFKLSDHRSIKWIALVIIVLLLTVIVYLFPENDRKDALSFLQKLPLIIAFCTSVIAILVAVVIVMAVMWHYERKLDKMEIERLVSERNKNQRERGCPIQSSEEINQ